MKIHLSKRYTDSGAYLYLMELEVRKRKAITKCESQEADIGEQHNIVTCIDNISW
jgi:hypothetical protein